MPSRRKREPSRVSTGWGRRGPARDRPVFVLAPAPDDPAAGTLLDFRRGHRRAWPLPELLTQWVSTQTLWRDARLRVIAGDADVHADAVERRTLLYGNPQCEWPDKYARASAFQVLRISAEKL